MRIYNEIAFDVDGNVIYEDSYEYSGNEVMLLQRGGPKGPKGGGGNGNGGGGGPGGRQTRQPLTPDTARPSPVG